MTKMNKNHCRGCCQNRYNFKGTCERPGIDAVVTSDECWHLEDAKLVWRVRIPVHQIPPYSNKAEHIPSCYSQTGYIFVEKNRIVKGYIR